MPGSTGTILCLCAHSDDQIFGPGATLAKYAQEGFDVHTIIFSYGEASHPHIKEEVIVKTRIIEAHAADKIIEGKGVSFLGLKEGKFLQDEHAIERISKIINKYQPEKIFTHANDDPHPDHQAVFEIVKKAFDQSKHTGEVYTFDVWTPFNTKKRDAPKLVVDVSSTYKKKMKAIKCFKSQLGFWGFIINNNYLLANIVMRNFFAGLKYNCTFAEVFYKLR